jgi:hypothetical protein
MNTNDTSRILDAVAADFIPADVNLLPQIAARFERKTLMQTLRARPALMILLVLLALGLLTGAAYAIGRSLGYIPGVGLVEQGASIRVLAEPVSLTRDGITLTVEKAFLTADKTTLTYSVDGIPQKARPKGGEGGSSCQPASPSLRLADGSLVNIVGGGGPGWEAGYRDTMIYPVLPATAQTITFLLPCLQDVAPAAAPQDWELALRFVPAPPELAVAPVIELATPLPATPTSAPATKLTSDSFLGITYNIDSLTRTDRGYILITSIRWDEKISHSVGTNYVTSISLVDAAGKKIALLPLDSMSLPGNDPNHPVIGFSLADESFALPLTLNLAWAGVNLIEKPQFTFDPGVNPQARQNWPVNQKIQVLGFPLQIDSARFMPNAELNKQEWMRFNPTDMIGFNFSITADPAIQSLYLAVKSGYSADGTGTSGHSGLDAAGKLESVALLNGHIIAPLTIEAGYVEVRHPWQITFNPADIMISAPTPVSSAPDASLLIEKVIPLDDGYYLIGRTNWRDSRFTDVGLGGWDARLRDANGVETLLEPATFDEMGITDVRPGEWAYRVYGKALPASLTLSMSQASVQLSQPYTFTFDPGAKPQVGQEWQINQSLDILGYKATVQKAKFITQGDSHGFEFSLTADAALQGIPLNIESGMTGGRGASGGGASPRDKDGVMKVYALNDGQFSGPILLSIRGAVLNGNWQVTWNPPAAPAGATPFPAPQACVTLDKWQQALDASAALPVGLSGKVLLMRGAISPDPSMFIASLDGSQEQPVAFGNSAGAGPNGMIVYFDENNRVTSYDPASGKIAALKFENIPVWSTDGRQLAYQNPAKPGSIVVMDADQKNRRELASSSTSVTVAGWTPDNQKLLISVSESNQGDVIKLIDIATGALQTVVASHQQMSIPALSPDGQWIAYLDKVIGKMADGIYLVRLDGSERRLLVQLDYRWMSVPHWSPDGKWLAFGVSQDDFLNPEMLPALVNLDSCQVVPLNSLNGEIRFWLQP